MKNRSMLEARGMPVIDMLRKIFRREAECWAEHRVKANECQQKITPAAHRLAETCMVTAACYDVLVEIFDKEERFAQALVTVGESFTYRVVLDPDELQTCECRCMKARDRGFPCDHGFAVLQVLSGMNPGTDIWHPVAVLWYSPIFHTETWKRQYQYSYSLPETVEKDLEETLLTPWLTAPAGKGRPKETRYRKQLCPISKPDAKPRKPSKCSRCDQEGHNRRSCQSRDLDAIKNRVGK